MGPTPLPRRPPPSHDEIPMPEPTLPQPPATIDGAAAALGRIPSGLFVVCWRDGDVDRVMLASWVIQAGFAPAAVSVAIAPGRDLLAAIDRGAAFVVNILAESQRTLLSRFGKPSAPGDDPFAGLDVVRTPGGNVALAAASGWLECRATTRTTGGDHVVVVAEVTAGEAGPEAQPLVHVRKNGLRY